MKHYRVNKLTKPDGIIVKKKDILASSDREAVQNAADSPDCPVCDVLHNGNKIASIT